MDRPERLFANGESPAVQRLGPLRPALRHKHQAEIMERERNIGMVRPIQPLLDRHRPVEQLLRLRILTMHPMQDAEIIQRRRHIGMGFPVRVLKDCQRLQINRLGLYILSLRGQRLRFL